MSTSFVPPDDIVAAIVANHPMMLETLTPRRLPPPHNCPFIDTLIPGLPNDVVGRIIAFLPRTSWIHLRQVSKHWKNSVEDPRLYEARRNMGLTEEWCYTEAWNPVTKIVSWFALDTVQRKWLALPPLPRKRGQHPDIFGRSSTSLAGELYVVAGKVGKSGPTLRDMCIYSPITNRWRRGCPMITTRHSPLIFSICDRKIFVLGGFDFLDNIIRGGECYDAETEKWTLVENGAYPEVICPKSYSVGWQVQWTTLQFSRDEYFVSYKTRDAQQITKLYVPRKGSWVPTEHRDKSAALMRYSLAGIVNMQCVMVDWPTGRLRYTYHPSRKVGYMTVPGLAGLDWVSILQKNPKVSSVGTKFLLVVRGLSVLMIETSPSLLEAAPSTLDGRNLIDTLEFRSDGPELEPLNCVVVTT